MRSRKVKPTIKINFTDFWEGFDKTSNFFYNLLRESFTVQIAEKPDFLFYSCYGKQHLDYDCIRIFYASENMRADFAKCDYALGFDYLKRKNHYRLPLYYLYIEHHDYYEELSRTFTPATAQAVWKEKTKFCCMLVSNANAPERIEFFNQLCEVKTVASGGRYMNNIGSPVDNKMDFIKDYKFVIAFENTSYPGYTTEKILEPLVAHSIPVYWGNPEIHKDFNEQCFINVHHHKDHASVIERLMTIDKDDSLAAGMLMASKMAAEAKDYVFVRKEVLHFLSNILLNKKKLPVAKNPVVKGVVKYKEVLQKITSRLGRV